ncbi:N-6 DNA methylase [Candidatus Woesebacteria bacterium]|nr:N-6 DNA methylase [Candidatus Woesebacteria bacterium]
MNTDTKRHIDAARQVLVGVVPNPTSQIDQITTALIYKFMDDIDQASVKVGGEPAFFVGDLEKYAWTRIMDSRLGNQERMNLYAEALVKFSESKQLPELFRGIFKSAFLPYRSPETLGLFLKEIGFFDYSHPEELGNAYEYLLSIMSSQGDAGQFRTPRHIIDFMVDVVNPTKDDKVLDPACGTGGFLIKSFLHILEKHDGKNDPDKKEKALTPDERRKMMGNFEGYDIDPGMVRIAQVNMYLHQFKNPKIFQYDSLSQDERWNDKFDVILANPPFMSPKGGITPHSKFSIQSSRSEVLFVDYIMNHLKPNGRAAIIVPEGIIFQTGKSHTELRKNLINDGLYAVISLPSGVFQPYSGVKTSILVFDKALNNLNDNLIFIDIHSTGVSLGATQKIIKENDLEVALKIIKAYQSSTKIKPNHLSSIINKQEIINNNYNLSLLKYKKRDVVSTDIKYVPLAEICTIVKGKSSSTKTENGPYKLYLTAEIIKSSDHFDFEGEGVAVPLISATGHGKADIKRIHYTTGKFALANLLALLVPIDASQLNTKYLYYVLNSVKKEMAKLMSGAANVTMKTSDLGQFNIPLPSIEIQDQIVAKIDNYQKIINGALLIKNNWKPSIEINKLWNKVKLHEVANVIAGQSPEGKYYNDSEQGMAFYQGKTEFGDVYLRKPTKWTTKTSKVADKGDILMSVRAPVGPVNITTEQICIGRGLAAIKPIKINQMFLFTYLKMIEKEIVGNGGAVFDSISKSQIEDIEVPFPSAETQIEIIKNINSEYMLVDNVRQLVEIYEQKVDLLLSNLWSE